MISHSVFWNVSLPFHFHDIVIVYILITSSLNCCFFSLFPDKNTSTLVYLKPDEGSENTFSDHVALHLKWDLKDFRIKNRCPSPVFKVMYNLIPTHSLLSQIFYFNQIGFNLSPNTSGALHPSILQYCSCHSIVMNTYHFYLSTSFLSFEAQLKYSLLCRAILNDVCDWTINPWNMMLSQVGSVRI